MSEKKEFLKESAKRLRDQLVDAMNRPDDPALVEAHERQEEQNTKERAKRLADQILDATKRPPDPALVEANERREAEIAAETEEFYVQTGQKKPSED